LWRWTQLDGVAWWQVCHDSKRRFLMRAYMQVVVTIIGLLSAYVALLPLVT
jgi:hypothetical protein